MSATFRIPVLHSLIVNHACKSVLQIRFFGSRKFLILNAGSTKLRATCNLVVFMSLRGAQIHPVVYLVVYYFKFLYGKCIVNAG